MKRLTLLVLLAIGGLKALPEKGEAFFRRRCRPAPCCPVAVCPCPPSTAAAVGAAPTAVPEVTINGKIYQLLEAPDQGEFAEPAARATITAAGISEEDTFAGTDRLVPKTTIVDAQVQDFPTVAALVSDLLRDNPDSAMKLKGIKRNTDTRVNAERHNVRVKGFIYAFKYEGDHDYHVILGDDPAIGSGEFLNVEVSGIPVGGTNANRKRLIDVRNDFRQAFHLTGGGPQGYKRPHRPVPVRITGSLFWDVDHAPGVVGPSGMRPRTAWEIHPVSAIEFLQD